jgi:hypothetical protein
MIRLSLGTLLERRLLLMAGGMNQSIDEPTSHAVAARNGRRGRFEWLRFDGRFGRGRSLCKNAPRRPWWPRPRHRLG